jgi:hypothetical protein
MERVSTGELEQQLERCMIPPIPVEIREVTRLAIELTRTERADRLVHVPGGPHLPAGTLVELFDLDALVDLLPRV